MLGSLGETFTRYFIIIVHTILTRTYFSRWASRAGTVLFISRRLCIKSAAFTTLAEAEAMRFIARTTTIPVPKVYSAFEHRGRVYILMERITGQDLSEGWLYRTQQSRDNILQNLKRLIEQLRAIPGATNVGVSNISGGPIYDPRLPSGCYGPFSSISAFHSALCDGLSDKPYNDDVQSELAPLINFYQQSWPVSKFTHGDLSSMNIMVRGDEIASINDWETAGWMPPYWEYTSAINVNPRNQFWQQEIDKFICPDPEALHIENIRRRVFE